MNLFTHIKCMKEFHRILHTPSGSMQSKKSLTTVVYTQKPLAQQIKMPVQHSWNSEDHRLMSVQNQSFLISLCAGKRVINKKKQNLFRHPHQVASGNNSLEGLQRIADERLWFFEGTAFLWNTANHLPSNTAEHYKWPEPSHTMLLKPWKWHAEMHFSDPQHTENLTSTFVILLE